MAPLDETDGCSRNYVPQHGFNLFAILVNNVTASSQPAHVGLQVYCRESLSLAVVQDSRSRCRLMLISKCPN